MTQRHTYGRAVLLLCAVLAVGVVLVLAGCRGHEPQSPAATTGAVPTPMSTGLVTP